MRKNIQFVFVMLSVMLSACGASTPVATATAVPTNTPLPTSTPTLLPTATLTPTETSTPTATPDLAATQKVEEFLTIAPNYLGGDIPANVYGEYYNLEDSIQNLAKMGYYQWETDNLEIRNFIIRVNVRMSTAKAPSDSTGCGIVFRTVGDFNESIFIQQNGYLYYSAGGTNFNSRYYGKMDNPAEFEMVLVVNEKIYKVYIDGTLALNGDSVIDPSNGRIGFAVQSGSDDEFGSQCNFADIDLWAIKNK